MTILKRKCLFTSESVTEGHPDKMCDQISDAVLDAVIAQDKRARVACEALAKTGMVIVAGEITTTARIDIPTIVRDVVRDIGYTDSKIGFDGSTCAVISCIEQQSPDISMGVTATDEKEQGAGDQGMMFGYATNETKELMPMPILLAHKITKRLAELRKSGQIPFLRPDGKSQVTVEYRDNKPVRIHTVVVSTQHSPDVSQQELKKRVVEEVVKPILPPEMIKHDKIQYMVNPTGRFVVGGPQGDCGLTGRKIIVDTYGGYGSHGGGAFSGKDPSKVDRSAAYMARHIAKNVVAAGLAEICEIQVAYAIGVAEPVSLLVNTMETGKIDDEKIEKLIRDNFELQPAKIIESLQLLRPIFRKTASYGHFGREEAEFSWEITDHADALRRGAGL